MPPGLMTNWSYTIGVKSSELRQVVPTSSGPGEPEDSGLHLHQISPLFHAVWKIFLTRVHPGLDQTNQQMGPIKGQFAVALNP